MMKNKIKITTKFGDQGQSRLFSGEIISKSSLRFKTLGDLDELVCILGLARLNVKSKPIKEAILQIQRDVFLIGAEIATTNSKLSKLPNRVDQKFIKEFEQKVEMLYRKTNIPNDFVVPGSSLNSTYLDLARSIARRCERSIVELFKNNDIKNKFLLVWSNRLSDYLYLMARFEEIKPTLVKNDIKNK